LASFGQASRAVGGNGRRTSHNPPDPAMLDIYDRIGVTVMDENRLFDNKSQYYDNMGALVKRDRNHPSVVIWSFCNEVGCEGKPHRLQPSCTAKLCCSHLGGMRRQARGGRAALPRDRPGV